jgi:hypothetical protein
MRIRSGLAAGILFLLTGGICLPTFAAEATAFEVAKQANEYVGKESHGKIVQIRSEKSINSLTPNIWTVVLYDPDATLKAVEVRFEAGQKKSVKRPVRLLELVKSDKIFDRTKLKVDSNAAIKTALAEPLLKNLTIKATQLWLDSNLKLDLTVEAPAWRVRLWAAKLKNPNDTAEIGDVYISAEDGKVLRTDLHPERVD